jgi:hypothetical protein
VAQGEALISSPSTTKKNVFMILINITMHSSLAPFSYYRISLHHVKEGQFPNSHLRQYILKHFAVSSLSSVYFNFHLCRVSLPFA